MTAMSLLRFDLCPKTAFATPLLGDTLFGQLCWAIRHGWGEARLTQLLEGYTTQQPFLVVSDALPLGHLPLPCLPASIWEKDEKSDDPSKRKELKKKIWVGHPDCALPLAQWQRVAKTEDEIGAKKKSAPRTHNSINRLTQTTGKGEGFAPYNVMQHWYGDLPLSVYVCLDESRFTAADLRLALEQIGQFGFGKDASVGLGKFSVDKESPEAKTCWPLPLPVAGANAWLSLAPVAPQGLEFDPERSFYRPFTRYGRHGDVGVLAGQPFKKPILLTERAGVFSPRDPASENWQRGWIGQGLGGAQKPLSQVILGTVHQGYAPAIPIHLPPLPTTSQHQESR